jgi:hypothetical protein
MAIIALATWLAGQFHARPSEPISAQAPKPEQRESQRDPKFWTKCAAFRLQTSVLVGQKISAEICYKHRIFADLQKSSAGTAEDRRQKTVGCVLPPPKNPAEIEQELSLANVPNTGTCIFI